MSEFPKALRPWAKSLSLLQRDLALALGPWVQRLAVAVGPLSSVGERASGAPDGYDGVSHRGSYERLLATDWLLADVAPDEFLRRATSREHLFHRLATREPHDARRCFVLLDAGPAQLGTPRLAHLALMVVLAARAEASGAELWWAPLQSTAEPFRDFTQDNARELLRARSLDGDARQQLQRWAERWKFATTFDEVWLVSGPELESAREVARLQHFVVADVLRPGTRQVEASLRRAGKLVRRVELELPVPEVCTSLIRNPFPARSTVAPARSKTELSGLVLANRIYWPGPNGELCFVPIPDRAGLHVVRRYTPPEGEVLVAVGWKKGLLCVTAQTREGRLTHFVVVKLSKRGARNGEARWFAVSSELAQKPAFGTLREVVGFGVGPTQFALALQNAVVRLHLAESEVRFEKVAAAHAGVDLAVLTVDDDGNRVFENLAENSVQRRVLDGAGPVQACVGHRGAFAWASASTETWSLHHDGFDPRLMQVADPVVAVVGRECGYGPGLITQSGAHDLNHLAPGGAQRLLAHSPSPIRCVATDHQHLAWLDAAGGLGLVRLNRGPTLKGNLEGDRMVFEEVP